VLPAIACVGSALDALDALNALNALNALDDNPKDRPSPPGRTLDGLAGCWPDRFSCTNQLPD
jgi:hypothetical protein